MPAPRRAWCRRWNPANAVTASRFLTLPPFVWAVMHGYHQWATLFILICGLLDKLDGLVARVFHCRSAFGELFDAITDALCYGFGLVIVAAYGWAPVVPVDARDRARHREHRHARQVRATRRTGHQLQVVRDGAARRIHRLPHRLRDGGYEVTYYFWVFPVVMVTILCYDAKRMLVDPVPHERARCPPRLRLVHHVRVGGLGALWFVYDGINLVRAFGSSIARILSSATVGSATRWA